MPYRDQVRWLRDGAPALALSMAGVAEVLAVFGADAARLALALAMALLLAARRARPVLTVVGVATAFAVQLPWESARLFDSTFVGFVCLLGASYSLGRHATGPPAWLAGAAAAVSGGLVIGWTDGSLSSGLLSLGILAAPAWVGRAVRERATTRGVLAAQAAELAHSSAAAAAARALDARAQVAAEIQVALDGRVRGMVEDTRRARALLGADPGRAVGLIAGIEDDGRQALSDVRRTLTVLRDQDPGATPVPPPPSPPDGKGRGTLGLWVAPVVAVVAAVEALVLAGGNAFAQMMLVCLLAVAMAAPLAARRSRPVLAAVLSWSFACALVSQVGMPAAVLVVGVLLAGSAGAEPRAGRRAAGLVVALAGVVAVTTVGRFSTVGDYLFPAVLLSLAWWGGAVVRRQAALLAEVRARGAEVRRMREVAAAAAITQERIRLVRELHDVVAHHVMVMVVQAGAARRSLESGRAGADGALEAIVDTAGATLEELGDLLALVAPDRPRSVHGMAGLDALVRRVRSGGLDVHLELSGDRRSLPGAIDLVAQRIVQESLTNVIRHAGATRARVRVDYRPDELALEVTDDGHGLVPGRSPGLGITGMRERALLHGGRCEVSTAPEGGVRVRASLPLAPAARPVEEPA